MDEEFKEGKARMGTCCAWRNLLEAHETKYISLNVICFEDDFVLKDLRIFYNQHTPKLQVWIPSSSTWAITKVIIETLGHVVLE